jgi:hypothetical protein
MASTTTTGTSQPVTDNQPSFSTAKKRVRALSRVNPTSREEVDGYRAEVETISQDRGAALLLSTNLESALESAIVRRLRLKDPLRSEMFGIDGAFGDFHAKILVADAIGLLGPQARRNLDIVRMLRNAFAHASVSLGFEHPDIELICGFLRVPAAVRIGGTLVFGPPRRPAGFSEARHVFHAVCTGMHLNFIAREITGPTGIDLNGLKDPIRASIEDVVGSDAEVWAVLPPLP